MRSLILILYFFTFTGSTIKAQEFVYFGAKGGINLTDLSSDNFAKTSFRTGFHLGLLAEVPLSNKISIQPEVLYSTQGTEADVITFEGNLNIDYNLDYFQVPVLAKIYLTESLSIEAGPSFNFLLKEEIGGRKTEYGSSFEFGGALGVSYAISDGFFVTTRYFYGFTNALDAYSTTFNNSGFQLGIGFMF
jgi:opacity protein-like surface antigen